MQRDQIGKPVKGYLKSSRSVSLKEATAILGERRCTPRSQTYFSLLPKPFKPKKVSQGKFLASPAPAPPPPKKSWQLPITAILEEKVISSRKMVANKGQNETEIVIELSRNILKNYRFLYMYSLAPDISYQQSVASSSNGIL